MTASIKLAVPDTVMATLTVTATIGELSALRKVLGTAMVNCDTDEKVYKIIDAIDKVTEQAHTHFSKHD